MWLLASSELLLLCYTSSVKCWYRCCSFYATCSKGHMQADPRKALPWWQHKAVGQSTEHRRSNSTALLLLMQARVQSPSFTPGKLVLGEVACLGPELEGNRWAWPELTLPHSPTPCCLSLQVLLSAGTGLARLETTTSGMECEGQGESSRWTGPGGGERVGSLEARAGFTGENGEAVWLAGGEAWNRDRCHSRDGSETDGAGAAEPMS